MTPLCPNKVALFHYFQNKFFSLSEGMKAFSDAGFNFEAIGCWAHVMPTYYQAFFKMNEKQSFSFRYRKKHFFEFCKQTFDV